MRSLSFQQIIDIKKCRQRFALIMQQNKQTQQCVSIMKTVIKKKSQNAKSKPADF